jgi:hypothetical protein
VSHFAQRGRGKSASLVSPATNSKRRLHGSFGLYAIGFAILIGGNMPTHWIVMGAVVLLGIGILSGVKATRQKDSSE